MSNTDDTAEQIDIICKKNGHLYQGPIREEIMQIVLQAQARTRQALTKQIRDGLKTTVYETLGFEYYDIDAVNELLTKLGGEK